MRFVARLGAEDDVAGWRDLARAYDRAGVASADVIWRVGDAPGDLFGGEEAPPPPRQPAQRVPRRFMELAEKALLHSDPERFALAYRTLTRLRRETGLAKAAADTDIARLEALAKAVRRDQHKMKAFVRFRETQGPDGAPVYIAWFEPDHHIVAATAPFFQRRFAAMRWSILTPRASAHWTGERLEIGPGAAKADAPDGDALEDAWRAYFAAIFNPARLKVKAMTAEMPKKYWKNLPEADLIQPLIRDAQARTQTMVMAEHGAPRPRAAVRPKKPKPVEPRSLGEIATALDGCRRCPLHGPATQPVPGEGPVDAAIMFVGEQPGDQEDLAGRPFVGPAGQLFDEILAEAGVDRSAVYLTNAVKHFKFQPRGKRRVHQRPNAGEISQCRWWLAKERALLRPRLIVTLGATALQAMTGAAEPVSRARGQFRPMSDGATLFATVHPSYLLRLPDAREAAAERARFVADIARAQAFVSRAPAPPTPGRTEA